MVKSTMNILVMEKEISIFKTTIKQEKEIKYVANVLDFIVGKNNWNFDNEDVDHILRIHANTMVNSFLVKEIQKLGFECKELF